jgi:hypothetical protein
MSIAAEWKKWQGEPSHWHNLDGYFKPIVTRFFITWFATAPVVAGLIENFPDWLQLPFDWWILWLASFFYAVAFTVHTWKCPPFTKRYPNYGAYRAWGHSPRMLVWEFQKCLRALDENSRNKLEERVIEKSFALKASPNEIYQQEPQVTEAGTVFQFLRGADAYNVSVKADDDDDFVRDFFWEISGRWTSSNLVARTVTWIFLGLALLSVAATVVQDILSVVYLIF